ncbi:hypothetical protein BDV96DRAFT_645296 [Lophiotrema nucula]|uniref:Uncharacterized protein n=1 Tax=Lophiotrema nucula TaxID=690887 RepID=A0A6A5ZCF6_9PLEO|nr:hypothetical protein BDV96DRAFT_645296 [Lophiotrema nucula]
MDKVKKVFHIRSKSKAEPTGEALTHDAELRQSIDEELAAMSPDEREKYLKEFEEAEKTGTPKKGSLIERLIERGNRKTEEELAGGSQQKEGKNVVIH